MHPKPNKEVLKSLKLRYCIILSPNINTYILLQISQKITLEFYICTCYNNTCNAGVAKLADAPDLGSDASRHGGSSPFTRTNCK